MATFLILALLLLTVGALFWLARLVDTDGYGSRQAPLSHEGWGVTLPSVPPTVLR